MHIINLKDGASGTVPPVRPAKDAAKLRSVIPTVPLLLLLLLSMLFFPARTYALDEGERAPDFQLTTLDGKHISYDRDLKGNKPVYLVFWATW